MDRIFVYLIKMPRGVHEFVSPCEEGYTIYLDKNTHWLILKMGTFGMRLCLFRRRSSGLTTNKKYIMYIFCAFL